VQELGKVWGEKKKRVAEIDVCEKGRNFSNKISFFFQNITNNKY
jgi:hypothetical protein